MVTPFTRTFHTVGQGAFYSECLDLASTPFIMIYDCGSDSLSQSMLKKRVNSDLGNDQKTGAPCNLLFISHFDRDHINGVKFLDPDIVIIPFLSETQKILLRTYNAIFGEVYDLTLVESPEKVFPSAQQIIQVFPAQSEEGNNYIQEPEEPVTPREVFSDPNGVEIDVNATLPNTLPPVIASGVPIKVTRDNDAIWEYITFNPNWGKFAARFKKDVLDEHIDWNRLCKDSNGRYIKKYFSVLKAIFQSMKPKNDHSLVVYSNSESECSIQYHNMRLGSYAPWYFDEVPCGCIYFGDATIEAAWLDVFYHSLEPEKLDRTGAFQVPHHGSFLSNKHSFIPYDFNDANQFFCIISAGENNTHGHPSAKVIQDLESKSANVILVTESSSSLFYGKGIIH